MKLKVLAVRDRAVDAFAQPMFVPHIGSAIRSFGDEINNNREGNPLYAHPDDYDLYDLGEYDDQTGRIEQPTTPTQIAIGKNLKVRNTP